MEPNPTKNAPPIGIMPKTMWADKVRRERAEELISAIERYNKAGRNIPDEWLSELRELRLWTVD